MKEATTTSDALLQRLSNQRQQRLRKNVQLLFLGLRPEEMDPIISLLRGARLAPRGRQILTQNDFLEALSERSWDLLICTPDREDFTAKQAIQNLKRLDKDIPVIQLVTHPDSRLLLQGLKSNMQAVVPLDEKELLLITIRRELEHLENRRRMRQAEALLNEAEKRCRLLMERSTLAIAYFDASQLLLANNSFSQIFGYEDPEKLKGKPIDFFVVHEDREELFEQVKTFTEGRLKELIFQLTARRADESNFNAHIELQETRLNHQNCVQVTVRAESLPETSKSFAEHDPITGLFNTEFILRRLDETLQAALDGGHDCNLMYIQVDKFQKVRSEFGTDACNHLARDIADTLKQELNPVHIKARLTDDSFLIIFRDPSADKAVELARSLCKKIADIECIFSKSHLPTACSIGVATITDASPGTHKIIERAHTAAENVKGGNGVMLYVPDKSPSEAPSSTKLENMRQAVVNQQFKLLFQPVVPLSYSSSMSHYEALLRLLDDDDNELSPALFFDTIESPELSIMMDRWVILEVIKRLRHELNQNAKHRIFISLTDRTWRDPDLLNWLAALLREYRIPANHLVFQFSESDCSINISQAKIITAGLRKLNCLVCIKHHGSSPNAEQIVKQINADYIKIDGALVQDLTNEDDPESPFDAMIEKLNSAGMITIAPLVENPKVMGRLWKSGVGLIQGYYLQPPMDQMNYDFFEE
ncbi:EAL domain-containing protein [Neptunomonas phycophila]|uniref:EAL domain-containing protein n=1 Tax=Neptunomonas phycophila TaxID=1572645 RepID=A0AAW7XLJ3_9GAMM|nr:EAL domain-containing protein [Neptunomonas phycophila]MDO6455143.1 EAL domain-containing protein [Neptunomonas phycophila]